MAGACLAGTVAIAPSGASAWASCTGNAHWNTSVTWHYPHLFSGGNVNWRKRTYFSDGSYFDSNYTTVFCG